MEARRLTRGECVQEKRNLLFQIKRATAARRMDFSARVCMYNNQKTLKSIWQAEERQVSVVCGPLTLMPSLEHLALTCLSTASKQR
jgi:hypothetical protein